MQTTLLGLGIAIILALVAALVGPYFVDWSEYRGLFEAQASRLVGMPVRITGSIDARVLPVPSLTLRGLEARARSGESKFLAREIGVEFALGPLMRGEWRATEMHIVGPRIGVGLGVDGRLDWSGTETGLDPDSLAIERLSIEDGRIVLADAASASWIVLDKFSFNGDLRSLAGPIRGEGAFTARDERHRYRLTVGRMTEDGGMRVRLALEPSEHVLGFDLDGALRFEQGAPRFEGALTLSRSASVVLVKGRAVANEPWRLASRVKTSATSAVFEQIDMQYGPDERALKLSGAAELSFGMQPRLDAVLSARQLDLDRFIALPEEKRRLPLVAIQAAADTLEQALLPRLPVRVGIGIDALTLAEATVQTVRGDFSADASGWNIESLEFRAPGATQIRASGRLALSPQGRSFAGPAAVESNDPKALAAWLEGRTASGAGQIGPLRASGDVTLSADRFAIERMKAEIDRKSVAGRLDYAAATPGQGPRLAADLNAAELDLDATVTLLRNALPGLSIDLPAEVRLTLDIGRATIAGVDAANAKAKLKLDSSGLVLERIAVGDLAGAGVELSGRIQGPWTTPRGALTLTLAGNRLDGILALLDKAAPGATEALRDSAARLAPAKLQATLAIDPAPSAAAGTSLAKIRLSGTAGALRVALSGDVRGNAPDWQSADLRAEGSLEADNGRALAGLFGFDRAMAVGNGAGVLRFTAAGPLGGTLNGQGRFTALGVDLSANGAFHLAGTGINGRGEISAAILDATPLRPLLGRPGQPAPLSAKARFARDGDRFALDDITAKLADSTLKGRLALTGGDAPRLDGTIEADVINAGALLGALAGMPMSSPSRAATPVAGWSAEPFVPRLLADRSGQIELRAARATVSPSLQILQLRGLLRLTENEAAVENVQGVLAGGRLVGHVNFQSAAGATTAAIAVGLTGADLAALLVGDARAAASGRVSLQLDVKGSGRTPSVLVGTLGGSGTISLDGLELASLGPQVFENVMRATDQAADVDAAKVKALVEKSLESGRLRIARADGSLTINAGQLRLSSLVARGEHADLGVSASIDLVKWLLDARLALLGSAGEGLVAGRPEISVALKGPLAAPQRTVDVSTLVGWLTLRAVDLQAKRLEAAEAERKTAEDAARRLEEAARRANEEAARRANEEAAKRATEAARASRNPPSPLPPDLPLPPVPAPPPSAAPLPPPPAAAPAGPSASAPPAPASEPAPAMPPPIDIRPLPGQRRSGEQRPPPQSGLLPEAETGVRAPRHNPPPNIPPARQRSLLESLFNPGR